MARKNAVQAEDQIKDQAFSELQDLIAESEKLLKDSVSLVGEEGETLRAQVSLKLKQALDSVTNVRERTKPVVDATENYIGGHQQDQGSAKRLCCSSRRGHWLSRWHGVCDEVLECQRRMSLNMSVILIYKPQSPWR